MKKRIAPLLFLAVVCLCGCSGVKETIRQETEPAAPVQKEAVIASSAENYWDVWCVYWDTTVNVTAALGKMGGELRNLMAFACCYDEKDELYLPEGIHYLQEMSGTLTTEHIYLTFVNDVIREDGSSSLKNTQLLERLFSEDRKMRAHISKILSTAEEFGYTGVEIDYENLKEQELYEHFTIFIRLLWEEASARGIDVRILLEPGAPVETAEFPEGPEYVVMCYNLYGTHSRPGPKADKLFLEEIAKRFSGLTRINYALANGGFDWGADDHVTRALTESDAETLLEKYACTPERDADSFGLHFSYEDENGRHTVWYADEETLLEWRRILENTSGGAVRTSLWRASD